MATNFDPSIYNIQQTINDIAKDYIPNENEDTLALGLFGYIEDITSVQIQNDIIIGSELGNELWPSRAKYEKNVIAHSIIQNMVDINAVPAIMQVYIGLEEEDIDPLFTADKFTLDKEFTFRIESFDFHLEYDLIIQRTKMSDQRYVYSARYNLDRPNNISKIINPYTATPYIQYNNGKRIVFIPCQLMQVTHITEHRKIISSSPIDNKTFEFSFDHQLADFEVIVQEKGETIYLTPVFEGAGIENSIKNYCFYTYIDSNTIRVRFDSASYTPALNSDVEVYIKTTKGEKGNFEYSTFIHTVMDSERFGYKNLKIAMRTAKESSGGKDRKSVDELRRLLPKESLSRGSIHALQEQDLKNYFNAMILDSEKTKIELVKKISNDFETRTYYAYLVLKDEYDNVIPTNTINIEIPRSRFDTNDNRKFVLKPGAYIVHENENAQVYDPNSSKLQELIKDDTHNLIYASPFMIVVTADPLHVSYYLTIMNFPAYLTFEYVNQNSELQFISTYVIWTRKFLTDSDTYIMDMVIDQNISERTDIIEEDKDGNVIKSRLKVVMVLYNDDSPDPYRYAIGEVKERTAAGKLHVQFRLTSTDLINDYNKIRINDVHIPNMKPIDTGYGYFTNHVSAKLYVLYEAEDGKEYGRHDLDLIVPPETFAGWTVTNMYSINGGLYFYYNYSQLMSSVVTDTVISNEYDGENGFLIKSVPVVKHSYMNDEHNVQALINEFNYVKAYIDHAVYLLENNHLIDFKLFNTYGKSTMYSIDRLGHQLVDRVHLTLNFEVRLLKTSDNNTVGYIIKDIKQMIEDLNNMESLHIPNLITTITNTYRNSIEYIEFLGFNEYGPGVQHLYKQEKTNVFTVPEFLTVNVIDLKPDINIRLA